MIWRVFVIHNMYKEKPLSKTFSISHKSARIGFLFSAWVRSGLNLGCPGRAIFGPYNKNFFLGAKSDDCETVVFQRLRKNRKNRYFECEIGPPDLLQKLLTPRCKMGHLESRVSNSGGIFEYGIFGPKPGIWKWFFWDSKFFLRRGCISGIACISELRGALHWCLASLVLGDLDTMASWTTST